MEIAILIAVYIIAFLVDFLPVIREKQVKEIVVYSVCLALSFSIILWVTMGYSFPRTSQIIQTVVKTVFMSK